MSLNPAIAWAQYKLSGGTRRLILVGVIYALVIVAIMLFITQIDNAGSLASLGRMTPAVTFLQLVILLLWGTTRVSQAVRLDVTSNALESHRLMPVSPVSAALGYLFGSTNQVLAVFAVNVVLGAECVKQANVPILWWLAANGVMLLYGVMLWTIVMFFSFRFAGAGLLMVALQIALIVTQSTGEVIVPGLSTVALPVFSVAIFRLNTFDKLEVNAIIAFTLQALIAGVYLIAACRRYVRDKQISFEWTLSLLLLIIWILASLAGIVVPQFDPSRFRGLYARQNEVATFTTSLVSIALLGILAVASTIRDRRQRPLLMAVVVTALSCLLLLVAPRAANRLELRCAYTAVEILSFFVAIRYVAGFALERSRPPAFIVSSWLFILWIFPTMVDGFLLMNQSYSARQELFTWSPIVSLPAALYSVWNPTNDMLDSRSWGAAVAQLLFAALAAMIYHAARSIPKKSKPATALSPAVLAQAPADLIAN